MRERDLPFDRTKHILYSKRAKKGIRAKLTADFAAAHGLSHIMPALCNCDYIGLGEIGAALIRRDTLARGSVCDYTVVGSGNPLAKERPRTVDGRGFWVNE